MEENKETIENTEEKAMEAAVEKTEEKAAEAAIEKAEERSPETDVEKTEENNIKSTDENKADKGKGKTPHELQAAIEAILFTMGDAVEADAIAKALEISEKDVWRIVGCLQEKYDHPECGVEIRRFDEAIQMCTKKDQYENLIKIAKVPKKLTLSDAVLETLSIVAYKQPITKIEIEQIRGVNSDYAVNRLAEYDLIKELGRKDAPGRPILYGTTEQFLRSFGVRSLTELPSVNTMKVEEFKEEAQKEIDTKLGV